MSNATKYNWCPSCWFGAKIEVIEHKIYNHLLCLNCGMNVTDFRDGTFSSDPPRYFSDEEWDEFWKNNYKETENNKKVR